MAVFDITEEITRFHMLSYFLWDLALLHGIELRSPWKWTTNKSTLVLLAIKKYPKCPLAPATVKTYGEAGVESIDGIRLKGAWPAGKLTANPFTRREPC